MVPDLVVRQGFVSNCCSLCPGGRIEGRADRSKIYFGLSSPKTVVFKTSARSAPTDGLIKTARLFATARGLVLPWTARRRLNDMRPSAVVGYDDDKEEYLSRLFFCVLPLADDEDLEARKASSPPRQEEYAGEIYGMQTR